MFVFQLIPRITGIIIDSFFFLLFIFFNKQNNTFHLQLIILSNAPNPPKKRISHVSQLYVDC